MAWKRTESETQEPTSYSPVPPSPAAPSGGRRERAVAVIGSSISIQGDLSGEEDLTIHGRVDGKVDVKGNSVTIGESGRVKADVYGKTIIVEGQVDGNLFGGDQIVLRSSGHVRGNLTAPRVALEDGAQFKGAIDMEPKRQARSAEPAAQAAAGSGASAGSGSGSGSASGARSGSAEVGAASGEREAAGAARAGG
jgi:cytoskeletal protein CcmA (bactofilin family)